MTASIASAGAGPTASTVMEPGSTSVRPASLTTWVGSPSDEAWDSNARLVLFACVGVKGRVARKRTETDDGPAGRGAEGGGEPPRGVCARVPSHTHIHIYIYHVMFWYTGGGRHTHTHIT